MKNKIIGFIQNNIPYILVILVSVIIGCIIYANDQKKIEKAINEYDISMLNKISIKEANKKFKNKNPNIYIVARSDCGACRDFLPTLQKAVEKNNLKINYINFYDMDQESKEFKKFKKLLDIDFSYEEQKGKYYEFIGYTPMIIISKDNKMIYGTLGSLDYNRFEKILKKYELI